MKICDIFLVEESAFTDFQWEMLSMLIHKLRKRVWIHKEPLLIFKREFASPDKVGNQDMPSAILGAHSIFASN